MLMNDPRPLETPRPALEEVRKSLAGELSTRSRLLYTLLLLVDLTMAAALASVWLTEPSLPVRTHIAFGLLLVFALTWSGFLLWTLTRRKVLLVRHRVLAGRLAVLFCSLFTVGALTLGLSQPDQRAVGLSMAGMGGFLVLVAVVLLISAQRRYRELTARRRHLERELEGGSGSSGVALVFAALLLLPLGNLAAGQSLTPTPVEVRVPTPPTPAVALGRRLLVYEIHLTSFASAPLRLQGLAVLDGRSGKELDRWEGGELARRILRLEDESGSSLEGALTLAPGRRSVVYIWLLLAPGEPAPASLGHRLFLAREAGEALPALTAAAISVKSEPPPLGTPPVGPGRWVAVRGPANASGHRTAITVLEGAARVPQRFAVDWLALDADGRPFIDDPSRNSSWYGYGKPVRSATAGRVARIIDGMPDNVPLAPPAIDSFSAANVSGNTVVVDAGDGRFLVYAHLKQGSITVREGERVAPGDALGQIGNSGHSLAPHLHFHVADREEPLASEGLPFVLPEFHLLGRIDSLPALLQGQRWEPQESRPAREVDGEIPLENMVVELTR
jgi:hypothetical protein